MRKRTKAREYALQILYQVDITKDNVEDCFQDFWTTKAKCVDSVKSFTEDLVNGAIKNIDKINSIISRYATNWQIERMATVDRNILRLGAYELLFVEDIPDKVTINEAVELAKKFGDAESSKFVNGILDKISKEEPKYAGKD